MSKTTWRVLTLAAALGLACVAGSGASASDGAMAPVANPADMSPAQRLEVYGHRSDWRPTHHARHAATAVFAARVSSARYDIRPAPRPVLVTVSTEALPAAAAPVAAPAAAAPAAPAWRMPDLGKLRSMLHLPTLHLSNGGGANLQSAPAADPLADAREHIANLPIPEWLTIPGRPTLTVPVLGTVKSKFVSAAAVLVLALILLMMMLGNSGGARRRRARRNRNYASGPMMGSEPGGLGPKSSDDHP